MDQGPESRCSRCDMRVAAGLTHCDACRRFLDGSGNDDDAALVPAPGAALTRRQIITWSVVLGGIAAVLVLSSSFQEIQRADEEARSRQQPSTAVQELQRQAADEQVKQNRAASAAADKEASEASRRRFATMKPIQREQAMRACFVGTTCSSPEVAGLVAAGASDQERSTLLRLSHAWQAFSGLSGGVADGDNLNMVAVNSVASDLLEYGISDILKVDRVTYAEAAKDIDAARGKTLRAAGSIVQVRRDGDLFIGALMSPDGVVTFAAVGSTNGIVAGAVATIVGTVVQRYRYERDLGGKIESIMVVGRFVGQPDSEAVHQ